MRLFHLDLVTIVCFLIGDDCLEVSVRAFFLALGTVTVGSTAEVICGELWPPIHVPEIGMVAT